MVLRVIQMTATSRGFEQVQLYKWEVQLCWSYCSSDRNNVNEKKNVTKTLNI